MSFDSMLAGQRALMALYAPIDRRNHVHVPEHPVDLDDRLAQIRLKDLAWRLNEELMGEVLSAPESMRLEEVVDAVHFYLELHLTAGGSTDPSPMTYSFQGDRPAMRPAVGDAASYLALTMHALKNRPWKQELRETDRELFFGRLQGLGFCMGRLAYSVGINSEAELAERYFEKQQTNLRRIRDGY